MTASLDSAESQCIRSESSRHKLPRRPGRAGGLAGPDGARDAVHLGRPFADQDRPDVAVVQVEFVRSDTALRGFQTQTWARLAGAGWKIVTAHVSMIEWPAA